VEVREPQPNPSALVRPRRLSKSEDDLLAKIGTSGSGLNRGIDCETDEDERPSIVEGEAAVHDSTALTTALQSELATASPIEPPLMSTLRKTKSASSVMSTSTSATASASGSGVSTRDRANGYSGSVGSNGSYGFNGEACGEHSGCRLRILDARPFMNAKANAAKGGGSEVVSRLGGESRTTLDFMNIANIHVMRESFTAMRDACGIAHATHCVYMQAGGGLLGGVREERSGLGAAAQTSVSTSQSEAESNFYSAVHDSRWLHHLSAVLRGATQAVLYLESGDPVLVHCSDGWDRTTQLCSTAQFLLDPYYRTLDGFQVLVEKEWAGYGFQFTMRCGHTHDHQEASPIFVQWLDTLWQIMQQFPAEVEFTEDLLLLLADTAYSRYFRNFLHGCELERQKAMDLKSHPSVWDVVQHAPRSRFLNHVYATGSVQEVLIPNPHVSALAVWRRLYLINPLASAPSREEMLDSVCRDQEREIAELKRALALTQSSGNAPAADAGAATAPASAVVATPTDAADDASPSESGDEGGVPLIAGEQSAHESAPPSPSASPKSPWGLNSSHTYLPPAHDA